jgi:uncharacterized protein
VRTDAVPMIVEGLLTTLDGAGQFNIAPMGPIVKGDFDRLVLRPFQTSQSFRNLAASRCGVFHVVDRIEVIAAAAIGALTESPACEPATVISGRVLSQCCRWFEFQVDQIDDSDKRTEIDTTIVFRGQRRPFLGFNRARHAIIEAAILATRVHLLDRNDILHKFANLRAAVMKTGGQAERDTFESLSQFVMQHED